MVYYKWINVENGILKNRDYQFSLDKKNIVNDFNSEKDCSSNALYFSELKDIHKYIKYGNTLYIVDITENSKLVNLGDKYKTDILIIVGIAPVHIIKQVYWQAVKQNGSALEYIKPEFQTPELCLASVNSYGYALRYVRPELQTPELFLAAVKQNRKTLQFINPDHWTPELYLAAVNNNGYIPEYIKSELPTLELCMGAVNSYGYAFRYVKPEYFKK